MQELVKTGKYTEINNNLMSSLGLIEENMELSHIHLAVNKNYYTIKDFIFDKYDKLIGKF